MMVNSKSGMICKLNQQNDFGCGLSGWLEQNIMKSEVRIRINDL